MEYYANTKFKEAGIKNPYLVREFEPTYKSKYYCFHKSHSHKTNDDILSKDAIQGIINKGDYSSIP